MKTENKKRKEKKLGCQIPFRPSENKQVDGQAGRWRDGYNFVSEY